MRGIARRLGSGLAVILTAGMAPFLASSDSQIQFLDVTEPSGIRFRHDNGASPDKLMMETFGSGLGWLDYDNDGWLDLYLVNGAHLQAGQSSPGNALFRNRGGTFVEVTAAAGVAGSGCFGTGVAVGDYDNDGFLDLFVSCYGPDLLYRNQGNGTFRDITEEAGVGGGNLWSSSAGFFDYDRDGDLDLYVVRYLDFDPEENPYCGFRGEGFRMYCHPSMFDGAPDALYRNNGDGTFTDVSAQAGIANPAGKGLGVVFADLEEDGDLDLYVANDAVRNFLYRNNGDGTFTDLAYSAGAGYDGNGKPQASMGVDAGDFDGDGRLDLFTTNFSEELNTLYRNLGDWVFEDVSEGAGLKSGFLPLGFGTKFLDYDNDGDLDLYVANGHVIDNIQLYSPHLSYLQTDLLYENRGGRFEDVSLQAGPAFQISHVGRGAAVADYDNDGDLDLAVSNCGQPAQLLRNEGGNRQHWVALQLRGQQSNRFGFGARVCLSTSRGTQVREVGNTASYLSSNDFRLYFGLGRERIIRRLEVRWPSGVLQVLTNLPADQILTVEEPGSPIHSRAR